MEERLLDIEIPSERFSNLTKEEREALYSLKDDPSIIIKGANKGFVVVVWDREDYLRRHIDSLTINKCINKSKTTRVPLTTLYLKH